MQRTQKQQLLHAGSIGGFNDIGFDHEVIIKEINRTAIVGEDTSDTRCGKEDHVGAIDI